jgi:hypothetical protein
VNTELYLQKPTDKNLLAVSGFVEIVLLRRKGAGSKILNQLSVTVCEAEYLLKYKYSTFDLYILYLISFRNVQPLLETKLYKLLKQSTIQLAMYFLSRTFTTIF